MYRGLYGCKESSPCQQYERQMPYYNFTYHYDPCIINFLSKISLFLETRSIKLPVGKFFPNPYEQNNINLTQHISLIEFCSLVSKLNLKFCRLKRKLPNTWYCMWVLNWSHTRIIVQWVRHLPYTRLGIASKQIKNKSHPCFILDMKTSVK